jgi:hypothetical protein
VHAPVIFKWLGRIDDVRSGHCQDSVVEATPAAVMPTFFA